MDKPEVIFSLQWEEEFEMWGAWYYPDDDNCRSRLLGRGTTRGAALRDAADIVDGWAE